MNSNLLKELEARNHYLEQKTDELITERITSGQTIPRLHTAATK